MSSAAERITEINRILAIFNKGCGNTIVPAGPATECEECTKDVLERITRVALGMSHDAEIAVIEFAERKGDTVTLTRQPIANLSDWAQEFYREHMGAA